MKTLVVRSRRARRKALVSLRLDEDDPILATGDRFLLRPLEGGPPVYAEYDAAIASLQFVLDSIEAGGELRLAVEPAGTGSAAADIFHVEQTDRRVDVFRANALLFSYHFGEGVVKPYLNPLNGPSGRSMLREPLPPESGIDHPWQRGVTFMHGSVKGLDCWNEIPGERFGRTVQDDIRCRVTPLSASLCSRNTWLDAAARPLMADERSFTVYAAPDWPLVMDVRLELQASHGDVVLDGTKEAGFLALRIHPALSGASGGRIENCYGAKGEAECWGRPAHWVDYSGRTDGRQEGVAVFDHPRNLRYPTRWHVRNYGLFAPNAWYWDGSYTIPSGLSLSFRWRIVVHAGDADQAQIRELFLDWEPGLTVVDEQKGVQRK